MELHTLKPAKGSVKNRKRIARGQGSGKGGTAARGHKGAKSRSGWSKKKNFEGGQMPLQMRLPKRGFKNHNRISYVGINVSNLEAISKKYNLSNITLENLKSNGIIRMNDKVKILGNGELSSKLTVTVNAVSESAKTKIEANGGSITIL